MYGLFTSPYIYQYTDDRFYLRQDGSEELIGTHGVLDSHQFTVTTKAAVGLFPGSGGKENIFKCLKESFEALKVEKV